MPHLIAARRVRSALVAGTATAAVALFSPTASADGVGGVGASCSQNQAGCTVTAQDPGSPSTGGASGTGTSGSKPDSSTSADGSSTSQVTCTDVIPSTAQLAAFGSPKPPAGKGHWVIEACHAPDMEELNATLHWQADGQPALPDPSVLAAKAESKLALVKPTVDSSPAAGLPQVVQLPTWAWLPKTQWVPVSATASVPGESVTATATPVLLSFSWGDGTSSTCQGPGTPYVAASLDASAASPTCGHTYRITSTAQPGQQFTVTATLSWQIRWAGGGQSGTLPDLTTAATVHWTVEQIQSVLVGGGS